MKIPIGVSNHVSYNVNYDLVDTVKYARQSDFDIMQLFVYEGNLSNNDSLPEILRFAYSNKFDRIYFHTESYLNKKIFTNDHIKNLIEIINPLSNVHLLFRFDEIEDLEGILDSIEKLASLNDREIYLENVFHSNNLGDIDRKLRKFLAVFSLANLQHIKVRPTLNIPALFTDNSQFKKKSGLEWCCQIFNFFETKNVPLLLVLSDQKNYTPESIIPCAIGNGIIPYDTIFDFIKKTNISIEGIILQYFDKINPLKSRDYLVELL